ncbi:MAG: glycoside hydrolase, partial [Pseudomonadota bacterium]
HDGGEHWDVISPDLSRESPAVPPSVGVYRTAQMEEMARRGVIYALAPSPLDRNLLWAGTDDGLIHLSADLGGHWKDVTPGALRAWDKVSQLDAGHFDKGTAYAAINAIRRDDQRPHIYRTHDGGQSWQYIVNGLPANGPVNVVREDPRQPGLLFAGTERAVYFSIDDGAQWHSLRLNMPASSIRDLVVHDNDLVIGTHGRSIWILDDVSPLRELAAARRAGGAFLYTPSPAVRVRGNMFSDTPLPPEEPTGQNPPDGAILDYHLAQDAARVTLEIFDSEDRLVRRYDSEVAAEPVAPSTLPHPTYWIHPAQQLGTEMGHHRFVWDLRYAPPRGVDRRFDIAAVIGETPVGPTGPWVAPGTYTVRLTAQGGVYERAISVLMDPRVEISAGDLAIHTRYVLQTYEAYQRAY